jgi:hypothetical protein
MELKLQDAWPRQVTVGVGSVKGVRVEKESTARRTVKRHDGIVFPDKGFCHT